GQPDEATAKAMLASAGLPVPEGRRVATPDEAVAAAVALGYPVAVKALGIAHKSEAGAVRLNLCDAEAVGAAARAMAGLGSGLYVERMVTGGVAELIMGITRDALFGPVMTVGSGGVMVELLKDSATLLLPASREDVEVALRGLKLFPLLDGFRGRPKADIDAVVDAVLGIADFAMANAGTLEELDINPLIACEQGAWIADALMVFTTPASSATQTRSIE
ncbi:acetate--CoA ligase family protein, partial [Aquibium oceanicum]|uniref:acetate--CoA ligase family protein n=1 Tax=Aquibium oceanicum TaxID=1670800 RepID=UPI003621E3D3